MHNLLTFNRVLGCYTFNLPPGRTCPGATEYCRRACYARRGKYTYKSVAESLQRRLAATADLEDFTASMIAEIQTRGVPLVRIHSSGDFYSPAYFQSWLKIIAACKTTRFFAFTRVWSIPGWMDHLLQAEKHRNFVLWYSTDPSSGRPPLEAPRIAYILDKGEYYSPHMPPPNCGKQIAHDKCPTCKRCTTRRHKRVTFMRH